MEVKIENLSKDFVSKIDDMAKRKDISRNEFLKNYFINIAIQNELYSIFNRNEKLLSKLEFSINENSKALNKVNESIL